jgi:hypothetical protein
VPPVPRALRAVLRAIGAVSLATGETAESVGRQAGA